MDYVWDEFVKAHEEVMAQLPLANVTHLWSQSAVVANLMAFIDAVDWTEPFFAVLGAFHAALLIFFVAYARRSAERIMWFFGALIVLVLSAAWLNDAGSAYHASIFQDSKTNYFDKGGVFISAVFSAPLVVMAFVAQLALFANVARQMMLNQKAKLRSDAQRRAAAAAVTEGTQGASDARRIGGETKKRK